jgi:hypothetical protein
MKKVLLVLAISVSIIVAQERMDDDPASKSALSVSVTGVWGGCLNGKNLYSFTATASGGTPPYTFTWIDATPVSTASANPNSAILWFAGSSAYACVSVTDSSDNTDLDSVAVFGSSCKSDFRMYESSDAMDIDTRD